MYETTHTIINRIELNLTDLPTFPAGRMQMFHQVFIIFGVLFSYTFGSIITYSMIIGVCIMWPIFHMFATLFFMSESPYYLYKLHYHKNEIKIKLRRIKGQNYDVHSDYNDIQVTHRHCRNRIMFIVLFSVRNVQYVYELWDKDICLKKCIIFRNTWKESITVFLVKKN